jgi:hypothetical protein
MCVRCGKDDEACVKNVIQDYVFVGDKVIYSAPEDTLITVNDQYIVHVDTKNLKLTQNPTLFCDHILTPKLLADLEKNRLISPSILVSEEKVKLP